MKKSLLLLICSILIIQIGFSQKGNFKFEKNTSQRTAKDYQINSKRNFKNLPLTKRGLQAAESKFQIQQLQPKNKSGLKVTMFDSNNRPVAISGKLEDMPLKNSSMEARSNLYLESVGEILKIENPLNEFQLKEEKRDDLEFAHLKYQQIFKGLPIYGAEAILHAKAGEIFMLNGRTFPTPNIQSVTAQVSDNQAIENVKRHLQVEKNIEYQNDVNEKEIGGAQETAELKIYYSENQITDPKLVWHIAIFPNRIKRFEYFVDAMTGEVIDHFSSFCQFTHHKFEGKGHCNHAQHEAPEYKVPINIENQKEGMMDGPETATAVDLNGINRTINTYNVGSNYFMIDASKDMHQAGRSSFPNSAVGVIWTINGQGGTPARSSSFQPIHVVSNNNAWTDRRSVSAHFNGESAYDYFRQVHGRVSINDKGGNVMSFYNIAEDDGSDMDNAFWNGQHIYYGNGAVAFTSSLAKSLDVAGHEMSHGVVQTTANLAYRGESGALNESFADIFATMIDRDDWKIGEDIVNRQIFSSGAMRDLSNPKNGGNSLNDEGYQPAHYNDRYRGSQDNGGVHINSGIPNHAFYWFATNQNVGKERAEKVFYRALDNYLVASSQFIDFRAAVAQSATDLYGTAIAEIAHQAMDRVGIPGTWDPSTGNDYQDDLDENPGNEFVMLTDESASAIYLANEGGTLIGNPYLDESIISKPSVSDDGAFAVFVGADKHIYEIDINAGSYGAISTSPIWRNAAISKDGSKVAALSDEEDNGLYVFNFNDGSNRKFELYNPTFTQGVTTGDVQYADVLEWDYSGEWVMYDALNSVEGNFGAVTYWDIGFVNVIDNTTDNYAAGEVQKLYSLVPENVSVGNPTFAKLSPYVIAFDYYDEADDVHDLLTANLETGDVSDPPIFRTNDWTVPNFKPDDTKMSFDAATNAGTKVIALRDISADKLSPAGDPAVFLEGGRIGVWYANGERILTDVESVDNQAVVTVFPNPNDGEFTLKLDGINGKENSVEVFNLIGEKLHLEKIILGKNKLNLNFLSDGTYFVSIKSDGRVLKTEKLVILK